MLYRSFHSVNETVHFDKHLHCSSYAKNEHTLRGRFANRSLILLLNFIRHSYDKNLIFDVIFDIYNCVYACLHYDCESNAYRKVNIECMRFFTLASNAYKLANMNRRSSYVRKAAIVRNSLSHS